MTYYYEKVSSRRTQSLFLALSLLFLGLLLGRVKIRRERDAGRDHLATIFAGASLFFLFYTLNYHTLIIWLTPETLQLHFGLFTWKIAVDNIDDCYPDETSLWRIGGAGIHFSPIKGRYRAMLNFLEHPRVVVALKQKQGPVRDLAFSTQQPEQVLAFIRDHTEGTR